MTQSRLNRAVARATGESLATVRRMGFSIIGSNPIDDEPDPAVPNYVDWDALDAERVVPFPLPQLRAAA